MHCRQSIRFYGRLHRRKAKTSQQPIPEFVFPIPGRRAGTHSYGCWPRWVVDYKTSMHKAALAPGRYRRNKGLGVGWPFSFGVANGRSKDGASRLARRVGCSRAVGPLARIPSCLTEKTGYDRVIDFMPISQDKRPSILEESAVGVGRNHPCTKKSLPDADRGGSNRIIRAKQGLMAVRRSGSLAAFPPPYNWGDMTASEPAVHCRLQAAVRPEINRLTGGHLPHYFGPNK